MILLLSYAVEKHREKDRYRGRDSWREREHERETESRRESGRVDSLIIVASSPTNERRARVTKQTEELPKNLSHVPAPILGCVCAYACVCVCARLHVHWCECLYRGKDYLQAPFLSSIMPIPLTSDLWTLTFTLAGGCPMTAQPIADRSCDPACNKLRSICTEVRVNGCPGDENKC